MLSRWFSEEFQVLPDRATAPRVTLNYVNEVQMTKFQGHLGGTVRTMSQ